MGIRTTVTLDEDVLRRLKEESRRRDIPFRQILNDVLRSGLISGMSQTSRHLSIGPVNMGLRPGLNYDSAAGLLEIGEGEAFR